MRDWAIAGRGRRSRLSRDQSTTAGFATGRRPSSTTGEEPWARYPPPRRRCACCASWPASRSRRRSTGSCGRAGCRAARRTTCSPRWPRKASSSHLAEEHRWGLGVAAFEVGSGYTRQEPLQRIARRLLADLADTTGQSAHLAVLHGRDVLYVVEERAPGRPPLVTDVGVRLPGPPDGERPGDPGGAAVGPGASALPRRGRVRRPARHRSAQPQPAAHLAQPTPGSAATPIEEGEVTPGLSSVASAALDHNAHPVAGIALTFADGDAGRTRRGRAPDGVRARPAARRPGPPVTSVAPCR